MIEGGVTRRGVAWFALVLVVLVVAPLLIWKMSLYTRRRPFEPAAWADARNDDQDQLRLWMVDDLLMRRLLDGKSEEEVVALLGPPDPMKRVPGYDLQYRLGRARSFMPSIDDEWLVVRLDSDRKVAEYRLEVS